MLNNPSAALRMLIIYAIGIPLAATVGYMVTNPLDYTTLGFFGVVMLLIVSPIFIKWHYPIMVFALACPVTLFFLPGNPPLAQVMVLMSCGIALVERAVSSERRAVSVMSLTLPLVFTLGVVLMTARLTGGITFHALGGTGGMMGGGKKYLAIFIGIATFYALTSRAIAPQKALFFLALFFLSPMLSVLSDVIPSLPKPLDYLYLLIPPSGYVLNGEELKRYAGLAGLAGCGISYMLARYGLRDLFSSRRLWRPALFALLVFLSLFGGFRSALVGLIMTLGLLFFLERLHRSRLMPILAIGGISLFVLIIPLAGHLPLPIQRSLAFLPLNNLNPSVVMDAQGSSDWRFRMWSFLWPEVPQYLMLGKGYALSKSDFDSLEGSWVARYGEEFDPSSSGLAVSSDFHNGPLSVLIPFGIWGAIAFLWLTLAGFRVLYRNYHYGEAGFKTINRFLLVSGIVHWVSFFLVFGAFQNDVGSFATLFGLSLALNGGLRGPVREPVARPATKSLPLPQPA